MPINALVLRAELLRGTLSLGAAHSSSHLEKLAQHLHAELPALDETPARVAAHVRDVLSRGESLPLSRVARVLGTTPRTLQRQLEDGGRGYADIVDDVRRDVAHKLLTESNLKLDSVAERVGYAEARSFRRACLRWFGQTPGSYRRSKAG